MIFRQFDFYLHYIKMCHLNEDFAVCKRIEWRLKESRNKLIIGIFLFLLLFRLLSRHYSYRLVNTPYIDKFQFYI